MTVQLPSTYIGINFDGATGTVVALDNLRMLGSSFSDADTFTLPFDIACYRNMPVKFDIYNFPSPDEQICDVREVFTNSGYEFGNKDLMCNSKTICEFYFTELLRLGIVNLKTDLLFHVHISVALPPFWDEFAKDLIKTSVKSAAKRVWGGNCAIYVDVQSKPLATAMEARHQLVDRAGAALIVDVGGVFTSATAVEYNFLEETAVTKTRIYNRAYDMNLGDIDLHEPIRRLLCKAYCEATDNDFDAAYPEFIDDPYIYHCIERVKRGLAEGSEAVTIKNFYGDDLDLRIDSDSVMAESGRFVDRLKDVIDGALAAFNDRPFYKSLIFCSKGKYEFVRDEEHPVKVDVDRYDSLYKIDTVILAGYGCDLPMVRSLVEKMFPDITVIKCSPSNVAAKAIELSSYGGVVPLRAFGGSRREQEQDAEVDPEVDAEPKNEQPAPKPVERTEVELSSLEYNYFWAFRLDCSGEGPQFFKSAVNKVRESARGTFFKRRLADLVPDALAVLSDRERHMAELAAAKAFALDYAVRTVRGLCATRKYIFEHELHAIADSFNKRCAQILPFSELMTNVRSLLAEAGVRLVFKAANVLPLAEAERIAAPLAYLGAKDIFDFLNVQKDAPRATVNAAIDAAYQRSKSAEPCDADAIVMLCGAAKKFLNGDGREAFIAASVAYDTVWQELARQSKFGIGYISRAQLDRYVAELQGLIGCDASAAEGYVIAALSYYKMSLCE